MKTSIRSVGIVARARDAGEAQAWIIVAAAALALLTGCPSSAPSGEVPQPTLSSIDPTSGGIGTLVTLQGSHLANATSVRFQNGTSASIVSDLDSQIVVTVPDGAISGPLTVETLAGRATSSQSFSVIPAPNISHFAPSGGLVGASVEVWGSNFTGTQAVRFGGRTATFTVISDSEIRTTVPDGATTGRITVAGPAGMGASSSEFLVVSLPTISSFAPSTGTVGMSVTIQGSGFSGALNVQFNGYNAAFTVVSDTQINATVPAGASTGAIAVFGLGGTVTSSTNFNVVPSPVISFVSPFTGTVGTSVTLRGVSFTGATAVQFNGRNAASFSVKSDIELTARVPVGAATGKISVATPVGTAISVEDFRVNPECFSHCPEWKLTGSNLDPREDHAAARLPDGKVLVTGGFGSSDLLRSTEIFDPATQSWTRGEDSPISANFALSLSDGRILATDFRSSVVYDPSSTHWSSPSRFGTERFDQTFTALPDGRVLMVGGGDSRFHKLASAEIYDPQAQTWSSAGSMLTARGSHSATLLADGKTILIAGGINDELQDLKSAELYDIPSGTFTAVANSMVHPAAFHSAVLLQDGRVLIVNGGFDAELFDSQTNSFTQATQPRFFFFFSQAVVLPQGTVLVTAYDSAELYQPSTGSWTLLPNLQRSRAYGTITLLSDGKVLEAGGLGEDGHIVAPAEIFCLTGCE